MIMMDLVHWSARMVIGSRTVMLNKNYDQLEDINSTNNNLI